MVEIVGKENQDLNLDGDYVADLGVPFICPNCNELFGSQEYLSQHTDVCHGIKNGFTFHPDFDSHPTTNYVGPDFSETASCNSSSSYSTQKPYNHCNSSSSSALVPHQTMLSSNDLPTQSYSMFLGGSHDQSSLLPPLSPCDQTSGISHLPVQRNDVLLSSATDKILPTPHLPSSISLTSVETELPPVGSTEPMQCPRCQSIFSNQWFLNQHTQQCLKLSMLQVDNHNLHAQSSCEFSDFGNKTPIQCPQCTQVYVSTFLLNQHLPTCVPPQSNHLCNEISPALESGVVDGGSCKGSLVNHLTSDDQNKPLPPEIEVPNIITGLCPPVITAQQQTSRNHLNEGINANGSSTVPYMCPDCGKCFAVSSSLKEHVRTHTGEKPFVCEECGQKFANKSNLRKHYRVHTQEKPYHCPVCSVSFSLRSGLTIHLRTHTGEKPYECPECGQKFSSNGNLKKHEIIHSGNKPFSCKVCGRRYQCDESLKAHLATHTGEKSYQCPICEVAFSHRGGLEAHFRTHTGEKPFSCDYCDLTFARRGGLKAHVRTHTGEKPYSCSLCPLAFAHKSNLNAHFRTHTGDKPFSCSFCDQKFAHKSNLKKHLNTHQERPIVSPPTECVIDFSDLHFDTSVSTSSSVISTVMVSPFGVSQDSNVFDLLDILEHPPTQALVKT